jgi:transcriptional regulator with XRE-family HTH domain
MASVTAETITPQLVKAARALLDWTAADLAEKCSVGVSTIRVFESGGNIRPVSREAIFDGLKAAGAWFENGGAPSVGLNKVSRK